jgi:hypothetical protein
MAKSAVFLTMDTVRRSLHPPRSAIASPIGAVLRLEAGDVRRWQDQELSNPRAAQGVPDTIGP